MTSEPEFVFLVGGARSGKSDLAVRMAEASGRPVTFVATATVTAGDDDMADRIRWHQADRPPSWTTIEAPIELTAAVAEGAAVAGPEKDHDRVLVIDCLTLWASNLMAAGRSDAEVRAESERLARALAARPGPSIVVSNEVGSGVHPPTELGRRYRDLLGHVNRIVAGRASRSLLCVAGKVLELTDPPVGLLASPAGAASPAGLGLGGPAGTGSC